MNATSNVSTSVRANVFSEVHILHVLRTLNKHCVKRRVVGLKPGEVYPKQCVQLTAQGVISEDYEALLRRICLCQGAEYVRVNRDNRLTAGFKNFAPYYVIEILMPRLDKPIDPTKAMVVGTADLFTVAAQQELALEQPESDDDESFTLRVQVNRTLQ